MYYTPVGNIFGDIWGGISGAVNTIMSSDAMHKLRCNPIGDAFANTYGFGAIHAKYCGGDASKEEEAQLQLLMAMAQQQEAARQQQQKLLLYGGIGVGAILLVMALT